MHKNATKCYKTQSKWCKNKHGASKIIDTLRRVTYLLLYVDDIILTACNDALLRQLTDRLCAEFAIKDLGPLHYFISLEVVRRADGFFLHQRKYAQDILEHVGMLNYFILST
jgi:hypothetical protein